MNTAPLLIPFFTAGFPELSSTSELLQILDGQRVPYIEVGLPHSDALADGPVIQQASQRALSNGLNIALLFEQVSQYRCRHSKLVLFSYYNPLIAYGVERSLQSWREAGGSAVLIPDLPLEESERILDYCKECSLKLISLVAPTSTPERIQRIARLSEEFIYLISVTGVTGSHSAGDPQWSVCLQQSLQLIRQAKADLPIVVGFGITDPQSAQRVLQLGADGVVIGSAIIRLLQNASSKGPQSGLGAVGGFIAQIQAALSVPDQGLQ